MNHSDSQPFPFSVILPTGVYDGVKLQWIMENIIMQNSCTPVHVTVGLEAEMSHEALRVRQHQECVVLFGLTLSGHVV